MWIADPSAGQRTSLRIAGSVNAPRQSLFVDPYDPNQTVTWSDSFGSSYRRENNITSGLDWLSSDTQATDEEIEAARREGFNPYTYLQERYSDEELADVMPMILDGELEEAYSPRQVEAILSTLRRERALQEMAAENPGAAILGGIAAALTDPTSYVPILGQASRVRSLSSIGRGLADAAATTAIAEAGLQATQRTRSIEETILNIGTAGVLGGGVGYFSRAAQRSSPLHPSREDNPLRIENIREQNVAIRDLSGQIDEISAEELRFIRDEDDSVGAARVEGRREPLTARDTELNRADWEELSAVGKGLRVLGDKVFYNKTILGRVSRAISPEARRMGLAMMDYGGMITKGDVRGKTAGPAAENIKDEWMQRTERLSASMRQSVVDLRMNLRKKVDEADVFRLTQRMLYEMDDAEFFDELVQKYGQRGFDEMVTKAKENAEDIHNVNAEFEEALIQRGILQDEARMQQLESEIDAAKAEIDRLKAEEQTKDVKAELKRQRNIRDDRKQQLLTEAQKGKPLGRDYGHAQLWNRELVMEAPDEFKAFLRDVLLDRPTADWLAESKWELTPEQFAALRETDRDLYDEILEEWSGDAYYHRLRKAEMQYEAARDADKKAVLDLNDWLREAGMLKREDGQVNLSEARKIRDRYHAKLEEARAQKKELEQQMRLAREAEKPPANTRSVKTRHGYSQLKPAKGLDPKTRHKAEVQSAAYNAKRLAMRQERDRIAREVDRRVEQLRIADDALAKVERRKADLKQLRGELDDLLADLRSQGRITAKDLKSAKRQLRKAQKDVPLDQVIDDVYNSMVKGQIPQGVIDRLTRESDRTTGRVKERVIHLDKNQRMDAIKRGWLKDDLPQILYNQYDQLSAELALREALEIGPGQRFDSWQQRLEFVRDDYQEMISQAARAGDRKTVDRLRKEMKIIEDDLVRARDRVRGMIMTSDGTTFGWINFLSSKIRTWQFARFAGTFLFSSFTDTATFSLRHGGMGKALWQFGRATAHSTFNLSKKEGVPKTQLEHMVAATELAMGAAAHARRFDAPDLVNGPYGDLGIGTGTTRRVTGAVDRAGLWVNDKVSILSGLPIWNRGMKIMAGYMMSVRIRDKVANYDNLSKADVADLASVGIGRNEAKRIHKLIQEHGRDVDGQFDPGLENWPADDVRTFAIAIQRDMNRAVVTPGVGDRPRLMDDWVGKLWLQFQTFAFASINRFVYPLAQRTSLGDRQALSAFIYLVGASAMVVTFKDLLRGNDPRDRYNEGQVGDTLYEMLDRSGVMGWTSPYVDSALKLGGVGGLERYARQSAALQPFGVNVNAIPDISRAAVPLIDSARSLELQDDAVDKTLAILPLATQSRLIGQLME